MQEILRHDFGTVIAIGIKDQDPKAIENRYYSFWNHEGTNGELHWITPSFAYFWTTNDKLHNALIQSSLFQILNIEDSKKYKRKKDGLMPMAAELATKRYNDMIECHFLGDSQNPQIKEHKLGYLEFFSPDLSCCL